MGNLFMKSLALYSGYYTAGFLFILFIEISDEESTKINAQSDCLSEFWSRLGEICSSAKVLQNVALLDILAPKRNVPTVDDEKVHQHCLTHIDHNTFCALLILSY